MTANNVILAAGKHDLRGFPRDGGRQGSLVALKMYFRLSPAQTAGLGRTVELLLHPQGYSGLQLVEGGVANLCSLVEREHLRQLHGWQGLLAEILRMNGHAACRLAGAEPLLAKPLALSAIPYGLVRRQALAATLYAVGDQAAVIPSFTGDGMSIALHTGLRAADAVLADVPASDFQAALHRDLVRQVGRATLLSRALLHPLLQGAAVRGALVWPGLLRHVADFTRLSRSALASSLRSRQDTGAALAASGQA